MGTVGNDVDVGVTCRHLNRGDPDVREIYGEDATTTTTTLETGTVTSFPASGNESSVTFVNSTETRRNEDVRRSEGV